MNALSRTELSALRVSAHARAAMARRGVSRADVVDALLRPDLTEPSPLRGREAVRYVAGPLALVISREPSGRPVLVTILLRTGASWQDADVRRRAVVGASA